MPITLYGFSRSRSVRTLWAAEEVGLDYTCAVINARAGGLRAPEYLAVNPGGKVPAMTDGDLVLTESAAIVSYIGRKAGALVPEDLRDRARYDQWCFFACTELEQPLWTMGKHRFALPREWRVPAIMDTARKEFARAAAVFSVGLGDKPFILGDDFTMADVLLGHTLFWAKAFQVPIAHDNLEAYRQRCWDRPARARAYERDS